MSIKDQAQTIIETILPEIMQAIEEAGEYVSPDDLAEDVCSEVICQLPRKLSAAERNGILSMCKSYI